MPGVYRVNHGGKYVVVRSWIIYALTSIAPAAFVLRFARRLHRRRLSRTRKLNGLCIACGYDLRARQSQRPLPRMRHNRS